MKKVASSTFRSAVGEEGTWGSRTLSKDAESVMDLYLDTDDTGTIEWCVDELDIVEHIGLIFEIDEHGKRTLVDYDGVFAIPNQALDLLEQQGIDVADMRESMKS